MKNKLSLLSLAVVAALSLGVSNVAKADAVSTTPVATPAATPSGPKVTFGGGIDTYYQFNTASAKSHSDGVSAPQPVDPSGRAFDLSDNTFRVGLAKFSIDAKENNVGGHIDLIYGQTADTITTGGTPSEVGLESAYVTYNPTSKLTLMMGKCATPIGFEVIESWSNLNYSRSFLYWYTIPVVHTCARANYAFNDKYSVLLMAANSGWGDEKSTSLYKDGMIQFIANPSGKIGFIATALVGNRSGLVHTTQDVADLDINLNPTSKLYVGFDLTYGQTSAPDVSVDVTKSDIKPYNGVAVYASYSFTDAFKLAGRVERLNDRDDAAGTGTFGSVQEGTATLSYKVGNFLPRLEYRYDEGRDHDNRLATVGTSTQRTYTLSTAYTF